MKTTGLTAEEAQEALPGQNINKVCHVYTSPTGRAQVLYDLPQAEPEPEPVKPKKAKAKKNNTVSEGDAA